MARLVACPSCNTQIEWKSANRFRPFCSERCKLLDLGAWFLEERTISDNAHSDEGLSDLGSQPVKKFPEI